MTQFGLDVVEEALTDDWRIVVVDRFAHIPFPALLVTDTRG